MSPQIGHMEIQGHNLSETNDRIAICIEECLGRAREIVAVTSSVRYTNLCEQTWFATIFWKATTLCGARMEDWICDEAYGHQGNHIHHNDQSGGKIGWRK